MFFRFLNVLILTDGIKELLGITQEIFPEISRLTQIILTYPVTSYGGRGVLAYSVGFKPGTGSL